MSRRVWIALILIIGGVGGFAILSQVDGIDTPAPAMTSDAPR